MKNQIDKQYVKDNFRTNIQDLMTSILPSIMKTGTSIDQEDQIFKN